MGKIISTLVRVFIAVGVSASLWVLANLLFDQVRRSWSRFSALAHASVGFLVGLVLHGNRLLGGFGPGGEDASWWRDAGALLAWPVIFAIGFAAFGFVLANTVGPNRTIAGADLSEADLTAVATTASPNRLIAGAALGAAGGVAIALALADNSRPGLDWVALIGWTVVVAAIGAGVSRWRKSALVGGALVGSAIGWILGGFGMAEVGTGGVAEAIVATVVPTTLLGARRALVGTPDVQARARLDQRSRAFIFLAPALVFILIMLVIPAIRTVYLSLLDRDSEKFVGLDNYQATFSARESLDLTNWEAIFTSRAFVIAVILLGIGVVTAVFHRRSTGQGVEVGGPSMIPLGIGVTFLVMAVLSGLRGTIMNNLWWVFTVTVLSTTLGLAVAVLADGAKFERVAKSIIFMPMAVSLVGASIIWRFMYIARDASKEQTGVINALWVGLGKLSKGDGVGFVIATVVLSALFIALVAYAAREIVNRRFARLPALIVATLALGWAWIAFVVDGVGGAIENADGELEGNPAFFVQEGPWNNFWLMVILIWIQTGFAMVILSAAIKAVPDEYIEAARVDGATTSEIFWRITLPTIAPTIGVVVTTLIVLVMKVFDIVKVVTNGQFDTQVLANDMFAQAFQFQDRGRGAALAIILFLSVLPVMYSNIRRMQREV